MSFLEIGKQIKARRNDLQINQRDLAEMAGISINTLYKIERGQSNPTLKVIAELAEVLGMEFHLKVKQPKL